MIGRAVPVADQPNRFLHGEIVSGFENQKSVSKMPQKLEPLGV